MSTPLTIEEIAEMAEVSRSTVSRVLNNHPSVRPVVRDRVLRIISENDYAPRAAARNLARSRTNSIGLLIPCSAVDIFYDPFFPVAIQGIAEASSSLGYFVMLSMVTSDKERDFYHQVLRGRHFDGLIIVSSEVDDPILPLLIKDRMPLVMIGRHPYLESLSWVDVDNRDCARQAVQHLLGLGHQRIGTIAGSLQMAAGIDRRDGYKQALLEAGLPIASELIVEGRFSQDGGYQGMKQLLSLPLRPTAVFVASDRMSLGALRALREAGLSVPHDIALVSFDDLPVAEFADVPLTTYHQPVAELGATAARVLIDQLERQDFTPQQIRLPGRLIVRESCGAALRVAAHAEGR